MKFDFMPSNPAFNIAEENNKAGTGGNTTLYRTATRSAFELLNPNGILLNVTLKGIIPDLLQKHFADYQTHFINLMDDIDVWPYNTCYFAIENSPRTQKTLIQGGLASKVYTPYKDDCFTFVYYSGANSGMSGFTETGKHTVIRKLPGRDNDGFVYDKTDIKVDGGWKFAFNVMESKKSYSVTNQPIRGGTICYIPTTTKEEAEKLKLFVEKNEVYAEYIKRARIKYHAFGMRNVKAFDISQIVTGYEIPKEWNITDNDLSDPIKLFNEVEEDRKKVKSQGQVYTPFSVVERAYIDLEKLRQDAFINEDYTFCDNMCGNGKFLYTTLQQKMSNGISHEQALSTIYGVDLDPVSIDECKNILLMGKEDLRHIVEQNIVCADALRYHYRFDGSPPYDELKQQNQEELFSSLFK